MDVQALDLRFPFSSPPPDPLRRRVPRPPLALQPITVPGGGGRVVSRRSLLLGYTTASIVAGVGALAWTTSAVPVLPGIDTGLAGTALGGPHGGLLLWIAYGLLGSLRVFHAPGGSSVWTFHFPFIAAAMVLGGPTAGAWVGFLSTVERRELESPPWYGALANHAVLAFAAVLGGVTVEVVQPLVLAASGDRGLAVVASIVGGTLVLATVSTALAAGTIMLREGLDLAALVGILVGRFGRMTVVEAALAWAFTLAYASVGWWAPLVAAGLVLAAWPAEPIEGPDPLTSLPRLRAFERALGGALGRARRGIGGGGLLVAMDLDGFGPINKQRGFDVGNEVLAEIGRRLRSLVRTTDFTARPGGDEFACWFAGDFDTQTAGRVAERLEASIRRPVVTSAGVVEVGVSIGVVIIEPGAGVPGRAAAMRRADLEMQAVKRAGGGIRIVTGPIDDDPGDGAPAGNLADPRAASPSANVPWRVALATLLAVGTLLAAAALAIARLA